MGSGTMPWHHLYDDPDFDPQRLLAPSMAALLAQAAVVGVPDAHSGEQPRAFLVACEAPPDEQELRDHAARLLARYKLPRRYLFLDALPKSPVGKVLRRELRDRARSMSGAASRDLAPEDTPRGD